MASILAGLFEHNLWANLRAVDACASLTDVQLDATVHGTADSVRRTLMHIASAEQRYVMRLSGRPAAHSERDGWPGADALRQALDESGRDLIELVERADPNEVLPGEYQGRAYTVSVTTLYVQAINHATEHRSQIATILTQQGVEPPDFSAWVWSGL